MGLVMVEDHINRRALFSAWIIPHAEQRYETVGDWTVDESGAIDIKVSDMGNPDYAVLVAIHELVEVYLCKKRGITDEEVTAFDVEFEDKRKPDDLAEPGDARDAPYQNEHCLATAVERMVCAAIGVSWQDYEQAVQRLSK